MEVGYVVNPLFLFFSLSLSMLATKLNLSADDAERWIVNLIRNAKLDAKIDAKEVIIGLLNVHE